MYMTLAPRGGSRLGRPWRGYALGDVCTVMANGARVCSGNPTVQTPTTLLRSGLRRPSTPQNGGSRITKMAKPEGNPIPRPRPLTPMARADPRKPGA